MARTSPRIAIGDLPETTRRLLRTIHDWYSGEPVDDSHIATHRPPKFTPWQQAAVDLLQEQDLVQPERVLGKQIEWALTPRGRQLLDEQAAVDLVGDYSESLRHRTGVAVVAHWLRYHHEAVRADSVVEYPGEPGSKRTDVLAYSDNDNCSLGFEVLTEHNNVELYRRKLEYAQAEASPARIAFVFPSRRIANRVCNHLHRSEQTHVAIPNFPLEHPQQRTLRQTRRYILEGKGRYGDHDTTGLPGQLHSYYSLFRQYTAAE